MNILIVDDDRSYRALVYEHLHCSGHDVLAVSDAMHAVALLNESNHGIDLVVLDLAMPRMSGDELMHSFAHWKKCSASFIIVSGAFNPDTFKDHPKVVGCLHKPFQLRELDGLVERFAERKDETLTAQSA